MKNIIIVGPSRAGKTTLAKRLHEKFNYFVISLVPFPKKQTQKRSRKPNEAKEINRQGQSGRQSALEPATPKRSEAAKGYKRPQCTQ
jgi:adenylate kinase family enzyme